jgi:Tol biopolymer transport system component
MFSPDSRWVVYAVKETGREEQVYIQRYPGSGGRELISREGGSEPVWSPTGREIFYRSSDGTRIMSVEVDTEPTLTIGDSRVLLAGRFITSEGSYWSNYDVSRDGPEFVMLEGDQASTSQLNVLLPGPIR